MEINHIFVWILHHHPDQTRPMEILRKQVPWWGTKRITFLLLRRRLRAIWYCVRGFIESSKAWRGNARYLHSDRGVKYLTTFNHFRYNNQLSALRSDLRSCKRKAAWQQKQIAEHQRLLADQQKQTIEYASRLDEHDKKNEETLRKFQTILQELNKCRTELQYWRSKSPAATPATLCSECGVPSIMQQFNLEQVLYMFYVSLSNVILVKHFQSIIDNRHNLCFQHC